MRAINRKTIVRKIESGHNFDYIIIGGGATGIGILLEAVTRGYSAVLLEKDDFTKSTSGKSTKLVHGGVRYLAKGDLALVREACLERGYLAANAPHIVKNRAFIIPVYTFFDELIYSLGLKFYDLLAGRQSLGPSRRISQKKAVKAIPVLKKEKLRAGIKYRDGQFDDSRLAISILQTALLKGGLAANYIEVTSLLKTREGKLNGVMVNDSLQKKKFMVHGKYIINATGVYADRIMKLDKPGRKDTIRPSRGIHLVVDKKFFPSENALMIPKTEDGRVLFAVPWLDRVVIGTTDTPSEKISSEPLANSEEIDFVLNTFRQYVTNGPEKIDVLSVFAGLRPLAAAGKHEKTREISRSHKIMISDSGLATIIGGKWTTYRKMAEDLVSKVEKAFKLQRTHSITRNFKLEGYLVDSGPEKDYALYGSHASLIQEIRERSPEYEILSKKLGIDSAMLLYSIRYEMAETPEDFLARRTRALLLDAREARRMVTRVAEIMAQEKGKPKSWIQAKIEDFRQLADNYIIST